MMLRRSREQRGGKPVTKRSRDAGFSAVEAVIAIVLMGTVGAATLNATRMSVSASAASRSAAQVETAIVNTADRVNRAPKTCDYTIYAQSAVRMEDWDADRVTLSHEYYVPGVDATVSGTWVTGDIGWPACPGPGLHDLLVQRVTISITSPDGRVRRTIQVVKSDV